MSGHRVVNAEVMMARAKELVDKKEVWYVNTNANTLYFEAKGHKVHDGDTYKITGEILPNNEIEWICKCAWNEFHDDCKHTIACGSSNDSWSLINTMGLRTEYKALSNDVEVVGKVRYKIHIESDDD